MIIISRHYSCHSTALDVVLGEDCPLPPTLWGVESNWSPAMVAAGLRTKASQLLLSRPSWVTTCLCSRLAWCQGSGLHCSWGPGPSPALCCMPARLRDAIKPSCPSFQQITPCHLGLPGEKALRCSQPHHGARLSLEPLSGARISHVFPPHGIF